MKIVSYMFVIGLIFNQVDCNIASFNIMDYGAVSDKDTDNSQAFLKAWNAACNAKTGTSIMVIPTNTTFLVNPVTFSGPCKVEKINFMISGTILAPSSPSVWNGKDASQWLAFRDILGLTVDGLGTIDGQGKSWWDHSCRYHPELEGCTTLAPTVLKFFSCNMSKLHNIYFSNSPQTHVTVSRCSGFTIDNLTIQSPGDSPNTDGIHVQFSNNLAITNTKIGSGDDCVSIGDYTSNMSVTNVECGPGHGISIGSLGKGGNVVQVENIRVSNCLLSGTTNGARIKTWQTGKGYVREVTFENLKFIAVQNPIIIDQNYCDIRGACPELETGVQISNVAYKRMIGTSSTDVAINLNCSRSVPCSNISMQSIQLESAEVGKQVTANCNNAHGQEISVAPGPCLLDRAATL